MDQRESASLETRGGEWVDLLGVKLTGDLRGLMFDASVEQRFRNPSDKNVEMVYSFPLPWGAVLLGVDVVLGDQHLSGAVVEKKEAEVKYEDTLSDGDAAIMLERNHDQSYSLNLGNLAAGESCAITLRYAQTLQFEQRGLRLLIPTVIAPRYGDPLQEGGLLPYQAPSHSLTADHAFELELRLHGELAQGRVASPSHPISVTRGKPDQDPALTVSLARRESLDRDFILAIDQLAHNSIAVAARDCAVEGRVAVLASFCPRIRSEHATSTAVKILVDCSGSMAGDSITAAKRALQAIIKQLDSDDRFSLSRFGGSVQHRSRGLWKTTETTRLAAQRWVGALKADMGGTEMEAALASTFALAQAARSDVLLVTDGEISAIDSTIASAKDSGHRVFIVGIGSSPAEAHLRRLAEATGGACDFVAPGEAVGPAVLRMFARLRSPRLAGLSLEWPAGVEPDWVSPLPSSVFDGDTVNVFAFLPQAVDGEVRLLGQRTTNEALEEIGAAVIPVVLEAEDTLPRMAATVRVQSAPFDAETDNAVDAVTLAVAYRLVTDDTNFLLIHERADGERATTMPELQKISQMVPAGWGGIGSVSFSRRDRALGRRAVSDISPRISTVRSAPGKSKRLRAGRVDPSAGPSQPAFMRRYASVNEVIAPWKNDLHWSESPYYTGLTPLGVSEWLRATPAPEWPTTYAELRKMGLGQWLIDWLEFVVATYGEASTAEAQVVAAFLYLMSSARTYEWLLQSETNGHAGTSAQLPLPQGSAGATVAQSAMGDDDALIESMASALDGLSFNVWPDQVLSLDGASA